MIIQIDREIAVDPLAQIVTLLRPRTVLSKTVRGRGRWGVSYPAFEQPSFALMLEGQCWLMAEDAEPTLLTAGDFILFPATPAFTLVSDRDVQPVALTADAEASDIVHGNEGEAPAASLLGGWFSFDPTNLPLLLDMLPAMIRVRATDPMSDGIAAVVNLIRCETALRRPGAELILTRLIEVLLVEAIRSIPPDRTAPGLLAGLIDHRLAPVISQLHAEPAAAWPLERMAKIAGMSRSAFAERFSRTVGQPPLGYLLQWRLAVAKDMLANDKATVSETALAVGYQSASAFSTAFSRVVGYPPRDASRGIPPARSDELDRCVDNG